MRGVYAIFATYFYFLLFAQFSFLEHVKSCIESEKLDYVMAAMGGSGLLFSLLTIGLLKKYSANKLIVFSFLLCAATALISDLVSSLALLSIVAALIGSCLAVLTVSLASNLNNYFKTLGLCTGLGTGLAYFACNIPSVFNAIPYVRSLLVAAACLAGALLCGSNKENVRKFELTSLAISPWSILLCFVVLVWFDAAAFYVIQNAGELRAITWQGDLRLWSNSIVHFLFAILAGYLLDKNQIKSVLIVAYVFLSLGVFALSEGSFLSASFYCAGVSLYSTALVAFPSLCKERKSFIAGMTYAIAGWLGSAMGIGMAQDLNRVPCAFIIVAGILIALSMFRAKAFFAVILVFFVSKAHAQSVESGRNVYIQEGCINCHSQFVRPKSKDVEMWGPEIEKEKILAGTPPLIGNRRLGPDLLNIGNRRSGEWLELHMIYPQVLSPGSRMPQYEYLFKDSRGKDLVAYLKSLGADTVTHRIEFINAWKIEESLDLKENIELLYQQSCAQCHGESAPAAKLLKVSPPDLKKQKYKYINKDSLQDLARAIKFGIFGTSMPGHEYFSDNQVIGLAKYVQALSRDN